MSNLDKMFNQLQQAVEELTADLARDDSDGQQNHKRNSKNAKHESGLFSIEYFQEEVSKINLSLKKKRSQNSTTTTTRPSSPPKNLTSPTISHPNESSLSDGKSHPASPRTVTTTLHRKSNSLSNIEHLISDVNKSSSTPQKDVNMHTTNGTMKKVKPSISASDLKSNASSNLLRYKSLTRNNIIAPASSLNHASIAVSSDDSEDVEEENSEDDSESTSSVPSSNGSNGQRITQNGTKRISPPTNNSSSTPASNPFTSGSLLSHELSKKRSLQTLNASRGSGKPLVIPIKGSHGHSSSQREHMEMERDNRRRGRDKNEDRTKFRTRDRDHFQGNQRISESEPRYSRSAAEQKERNHR
ncbi:12459_t:CDS:2, partial [Acaulospora colombiana]